MSACVRLGLLVLRSGRAQGQPDALLLRWKSLVREMLAESTERGALHVILVYIFEVWGAQEFERVIHMYAEIARDYPSAGDDMETIAQMLRREGRAEGRAEGRNEGRAEGRNEGQAEGQRAMLLSVIQQRLGAVPEAVRAQVEAADAAGLQRWLVRALACASVEELQAG